MLAGEGNAASSTHPPTTMSGAAGAGAPVAEHTLRGPVPAREAAADPSLPLEPGAVTRLLLLAMLALTTAHGVALYVHHGLGYDYALGLVPLFDFNMESNAPTWFSAALLLGVGVVAALIGRRATPMRGYWYAVAGVAVFLSLDESAQIHELVTVALRRGLAVGPGFSVAVVVIVSLVPVLVGAAGFYRFVRALPRPTAAGLLVAAAVYLGGAVGVDTVVAALDFGGGGGALSLALHTVEELLEMTGVILAIHVLLTHLAREARGTAPARTGRAAA